MQARLCEDLVNRKAKTRLGGYTNFMRGKADNGDILHELKQEVKRDWLASINRREKLLNKGKYARKKVTRSKGGSFKENEPRFRGASEYLSKGGTTFRDGDTTEMPSRSRGNTCLTAFSPMRSKEHCKSRENAKFITPSKSRQSPVMATPGTLDRRATMASAKWKKRRELKSILDRPKKEKEEETELKMIRKQFKLNYFETKKRKINSFESDTSLWLRRELKRKKLKNQKSRHHRGKFAKYCDGLTNDHIKKENLNADFTLTGPIEKNPIFGFSKYNSLQLIGKISKRSSRKFC